MNNSQITIFYSWQSDLPGNKTRSIIQESIKDAVRLLRDTVDVEADRDTLGEYGSPDIAQTIFKKIDNCDIFVADVSAVCKFKITDKNGEEKIKLMPNPNVMLELGYAIRVVGWENIICILNSDYGAPEDMPFDIANRRLTSFSLNGEKSKGDVKRYIRGIIQDTVENILKSGKRVKNGFSNLCIGCYSEGVFFDKILPYSISDSVKFNIIKENMIEECRYILREIKDIIIPTIDCEDQNECDLSEIVAGKVTTKEEDLFLPIESKLNIDLFKAYKVVIDENTRNTICDLAKQYLGEIIDSNGDFFSVGSLKKRYQCNISVSYEYEGTFDEQKKYDKLMLLQYKLLQLDIWDRFVVTFDGYSIIALAIENRSTIVDENIDVFVKVNTEKAEIIVPSEKLINSSLDGLEGLIFEDDIIKNLLMMRETADIEYDSDISYSIEDIDADIRYRFSAGGINGNSRYNINDYKRELSKFIATPIENSESIFSFQIKTLRPNEKKWLGPSILLKALSDDFELSYTIKSKHSDGNLNGIIKYDK